MYTICQKTLLQACHQVGSQAELARRLGITRTRGNNWLNRGDKIEYEYVIAIEHATGKEISRYELAPQLKNDTKINDDRHFEQLAIKKLHDRILRFEKKFCRKIHRIEQAIINISRHINLVDHVL